MSTVKYEMDGFDELSAYLRKASDEVRESVDDELSDIAAEIEGDAVLKITHGAKTGRIYRRGKTTHQASAKGESPASDTGTLIKSIYSEKLRDLTYIVGSRLAYAAYLEFGTRTIYERPYMRPVVEGYTDTFVDRLGDAILRGLE